MPVEQLTARPVQALASAGTQDVAGLREGSQLEGRVVAVNPDSSLRLATRFGLIDADQSQVTQIGGGGHGHGRGKLPPAAELIGTMVKLEVAGHSATGRLIVSLIVGGEAQPEQASHPETSTSGSETAARITSDMAQLVSRQDGLAPVFAGARQMSGLPQALPEELERMLQDLQGHALNARAEMSALTFRQAVAASGLFLEARLARRMSGIADGASDFALDPDRTLASQDMKAALYGLKSALETWIASLPANQSDGSDQQEAAPLPGQTGSGAPSDQPALHSSALSRSFANSDAAFDTEALFAVLRPPPTIPSPSASVNPQTAASARQPNATGLPTVGIGRQDPVTMATLGTWLLASGQPLDTNRLALYGGRPPLATGPGRPRPLSDSTATARPPPPRRGSLPQGQAAIRMIAEPDSRQIQMARKLSVKVADALARVTLGQYASLSEAVSGQTTDGTTSSTGRLPPHVKPPDSWLFEIPLRVGSDTSIAQFEIDQIFDASNPQGSAGRAWRVQFSLDISPIGPLHARLMLAGKRLSVGFWAENVVWVGAIETQLTTLRASLEAQHFVIDEIHVAAGRPPSGPPVRAGGFIDRNA